MTAPTIFALATPPGRSAIAVIRISGTDAHQALAALGIQSLPLPRMASRRLLRTAGVVIDDALVLWFPGPASYTGEDAAEVHVHGSQAVIKNVLMLLSTLPNTRMAEPGEFTRRAFDHGKIDLIQAEGIADLIDAETELQHRQALSQLDGHASASYESMRTRLITAMALLESCLDFPDEDIPYDTYSKVDNVVEALIDEITDYLSEASHRRKIREGFELIIFGPPNVGKSSLLNRLARSDVAIVSPIPGTTRDIVTAHLNIGGYPVRLADTAGLRETTDEIERLGIARAQTWRVNADICLLVADVKDWKQRPEWYQKLQDSRTILVLNKCDLLMEAWPENIANRISISTLNGDSLDSLYGYIQEFLQRAYSPRSSLAITRIRHAALLDTAITALRDALNQSLPELKAEEMRLAARAIGQISGRINMDLVLGEIFSMFCIGK